jgi:hypothetical protein
MHAFVRALVHVLLMYAVPLLTDHQDHSLPSLTTRLYHSLTTTTATAATTHHYHQDQHDGARRTRRQHDNNSRKRAEKVFHQQRHIYQRLPTRYQGLRVLDGQEPIRWVHGAVRHAHSKEVNNDVAHNKQTLLCYVTSTAVVWPRIDTVGSWGHTEKKSTNRISCPLFAQCTEGLGVSLMRELGCCIARCF